jgi:hypothetical protein
VSLSQVIADRGHPEGQPNQTGGGTAELNLLSEVMGVKIAQITIEQRHADADLSFVKILLGPTQPPIESAHAALPSLGQLP